MVRFVVVLALVCVAQAANAGGYMLYASAARGRAVHGYCLAGNGGFTGSPPIIKPVSGDRPRKLSVGSCGVLFVAQDDRVEAFRIGPKGGIEVLGHTEPLDRLNPEGLAVSDDCGTVYVPDRRRDRILAYQFDVAAGAFAKNADGEATFTSCYLGPSPSRYHTVLLRNGLLYVSGVTGNQGINILPIAADGALPNAPEDCDLEDTRPVISAAATFRTRLDGPSSFVINDDLNMLYVERRFAQRISVFRLRPDLFDVPTGEKGKDQQQAESKTDAEFSYVQLLQHKSTVYATHFRAGKVDVFRLKPDGSNTGDIQAERIEGAIDPEARTTPVRMAEHPDDALDVLYVANGANNDVSAYQLTADKGFPQPNVPFSRTNPVRHAFLNDVAVAELSDSTGCQ